MKKSLCAIVVLLGAAVLCNAAGIAEESQKAMEKADISYAFGMYVASGLMDLGLEFNYGEFNRGFRAFMESEKTRLSMDEAEGIIQAAFDKIYAQDNEELLLEAEKNLAEGNAFLAENAQRNGVIVTASGLQFELLFEGDGEIPGISDTVLVHYSGATIDGNVFDSTYEDGEPFDMPLAGVISGWSEGLRMMKEGSRAILYIPPDLAYGERGMYGIIPPNAVLIFEVELLEIVR